jgi:hypothetical protein
MDGSCRIELQLFEHVLAATLSLQEEFDLSRSPFWAIWAICQHIHFWDEIARVSARRLFPVTGLFATTSIASNESLTMVKPEPIDDNEYERQRLANIEKNKKLLK